MKKMTKYLVLVLGAVMVLGTAKAQQLPDPHFEDWSAEFNKEKQLKDWHGSTTTWWTTGRVPWTTSAR